MCNNNRSSLHKPKPLNPSPNPRRNPMNLLLRLQHDAARAAAQAAAQAAAAAAAAPDASAPGPAPGPQSTIQNPKSKIECVALTQDGSPCRARPVDGEAFCPF